MTESERALIKAAINWAHADHTPMRDGQDNPAEVQYHDEAMAAALVVMHELIRAGKIPPISRAELRTNDYQPPFPRGKKS